MDVTRGGRRHSPGRAGGGAGSRSGGQVLPQHRVSAGLRSLVAACPGSFMMPHEQRWAQRQEGGRAVPNGPRWNRRLRLAPAGRTPPHLRPGNGQQPCPALMGSWVVRRQGLPGCPPPFHRKRLFSSAVPLGLVPVRPGSSRLAPTPTMQGQLLWSRGPRQAPGEASAGGPQGQSGRARPPRRGDRDAS